MPQDQGISPLFSDTTPGSQPPQEEESQISLQTSVQPTKTSENIFGAIEGKKEEQKEESSPLNLEVAQKKESEKKESPNTKSEIPLPNVTEKVQSVQGLGLSPQQTTISSILPKESSIPAEKVQATLQKTVTSALPTQTSSLPNVGVSEVLSDTTAEPLEKIQTEQLAKSGSGQEQTSFSKNEDPVLATYLQADCVYQAMLRLDNQEKIRFRLAVRYLLLMFGFFLVFAWIVNNRIIMFGFSEFVWLARIRDGLFASIAGLFALTIWFGSVTWTRTVIFVSLMRMIGILFFIAVLAALYLPY